MSIATATATFFRAQWALRLEDTCHIQRLTGNVLNTGTGVNAPTYSDIYGTAGVPAACLVRPSSASDTQSGQQQVELRGYTVMIPWNQDGVLPDDLVTVTSTNDGMLNGLTFTVRNIQTDTYDHVRRLNCEEVVGG